MIKDNLLMKEEYYETIWFIRQYPKAKAELSNIVFSGAINNDGLPHGTGTSDPTPALADQLIRAKLKTKPIETALEKIPTEYRKGIMDNIIKRNPYPTAANPKTWKKWKRRFVYQVAMERSKQHEI